jgi:ribosomal protein S6
MEKGLKNEILKLRSEGKTYNEIREVLKCTKSVISYHCKNANLENSNILKSPSEEEIETFQKLYDETKSSIKVSELTGWSKPTVLRYIIVKQKKTKEEKKKNNVEQVISWRKNNKQKLIEYKGGCCEICRYDKCIEALEFHHKNPLEKDFGISGVSRSFEKMKREVDKCILVCANCHREIHAKLNMGQ